MLSKTNIYDTSGHAPQLRVTAAVVNQKCQPLELFCEDLWKAAFETLMRIKEASETTHSDLASVSHTH